MLLRHAESQWNLENRFSGWVDVPLSKKGVDKAEALAKRMSKLKIDVVYTSPLIRNQETVSRILRAAGGKYPIFFHFQGKMKEWANFKEVNKNYIPVYVSEKLNERYYGNLQGLDKKKTIKKYGAPKVLLWRRGFKNSPPGGEGLDEVFKRVIPFYREYVEKDLRKGKNVLIVSSHNALRALIKYLENISEKDLVKVEIETGSLIEYKLDKNLEIVSKKTI